MENVNNFILIYVDMVRLPVKFSVIVRPKRVYEMFTSLLTLVNTAFSKQEQYRYYAVLLENKAIEARTMNEQHYVHLL